jgi:hypothetical protein
VLITVDDFREPYMVQLLPTPWLGSSSTACGLYVYWIRTAEENGSTNIELVPNASLIVALHNAFGTVVVVYERRSNINDKGISSF